MSEAEDKSEVRREALRQFMLKTGLTPSAWARKARLPNANALYNFLNGRSAMLSSETYEKLAGAVQGATISILMGEVSYVLADQFRFLTVRKKLALGLWRAAVELETDDQYKTAVPDPHVPEGAYGAEVTDESMLGVYREGSVLACVPLFQHEIPLAAGQRVVVHRYRGGRVEATCREMFLDEDGGAWLRFVAPAPKYQMEAIPMPWPYTGPFKSDGETVEVAAVVVGSWRSEL